MGRLCEAERARREAIDDLIQLGVVRSRRLVSDIGEALASRFYDAPLVTNVNEPGYDLVAPDGRLVQVRALRSEPHRERMLMGVMKEPYDALFAVKLSVERSLSSRMRRCRREFSEQQLVRRRAC